MLRYLLDGHPEICCHGEVFIRKGYLRFIFKDRRSFGLAPGYKEMLESYKSKPLEEFISSNLLSTFDKGGASSTNKLTIKKKSLFKYLDLVEYRDKKIRSEFTNHTIYDVWYEDILEDRENRISGILEFLGVDIIDLQPTTRKLIKDYRSHIKNLSEVHGWLSSSPYAQRVDLQRAR